MPDDPGAGKEPVHGRTQTLTQAESLQRPSSSTSSYSRGEEQNEPEPSPETTGDFLTLNIRELG